MHTCVVVRPIGRHTLAYMLNTTVLLTATLASPQTDTVTQSTAEFDPDRAVVTILDDGLEIQAFDDGELVAVLLMTVDAERLQLDASFVDGFVEGVMPSSPADFDPPPEMISSDQLRQLCEGYEPESDSEGDVMWWATDLGDPCAATARVGIIFELAEGGIAESEAELNIRPKDDALLGPTKKECIVRFAVAGTVCGFTIAFPYTIFAAIACLKGVFDTWCGCGKYLPVKVC